MQSYQIRIKGHLDPRWESLFDGFTITHGLGSDQQPFTIIHGPVADQSALYGLLSRLRDIGAALVSLQPDETGASITDQPAH